MSVDSCLVELRHLRIEIRGISPKLSTYAKLKAREAELLKIVGDDDSPRPSSDKVIAVKKAAASMRCPIGGCANLRQSMGGRKSMNSYGIRERRAYCRHHKKEINAKKRS